MLQLKICKLTRNTQKFQILEGSAQTKWYSQVFLQVLQFSHWSASVILETSH
jgi:hypothetical protein